MKAFVKSIPFVGAAVRAVHRRLMPLESDATRRLRRAFRGNKHAYVVQIGSNEGTRGDPIHSLLLRNPSWRALLVEPIPFLFDRLRENYSNHSNLRFENVAIAERPGTSTFYYVDAAAKDHVPGLPGWFDQLGSFDRGHIARHFGDALERFTVTAEVPTLPLAALLERNHVANIDLLHIDTEGYDWVILGQLDLTKYQPKVILFEHKHLSEGAKGEARAFLDDSYEITDLGADYFCLRWKGR